ncbi:ABC transporter permease [Tessaracoccus sp. ZS01]|uniref:ABC transporter permease n=1 Tax=Tessaracoccus sp. ZS01 TaxID=1906324 RepID=UPI00096F7E89|nr:ABC transporter permease [Tessaracoccus sp. ZS01]MCG6567826.1 ABC transporter permease [Tessaracoccus sp. ZS01]OMG55559.1 sugar ABC transporter permease [Tessaracoccus sp. ZS01]
MSTATVSTSRRRARVTRDAHLIRLFGILIALTAFFLIVKTDAFISVGTWQSMGVQFPEYGLMALGVMLTMITGGIDLSSVGIANMTAIAAASIMLTMAPAGADTGQQATGVAVGVVVSLVMGALAGLFNGFLVAKVRIPAILVTLGTLELFTGIAIIITAGKPLSGLPPVYGETFGGKVLGVPTPLVVFVVVAVIIWFILHRMAFGSKLYMLGSNATAAKFSGLNATSLLLRTYMISGLASAMAGLVMLANYNSAKADYGVAYTLLTILIVVLGGVHPNGGSGKLIGVVLAIAILQILSSGLNMFPDISNFYRPLIWGAVLLTVISTQDLGRDFWSRFRKRKEQ